MKTTFLFTVTTLLLSLLSLSSSAKWIHVKFRPKEVFIYEWRSNKSTLFSNSFIDGSHVIRYSLQIDSISREKISFSARIIHNINEPTNRSLSNSSDYGYPQLEKFYQEGKITDIIEETLYQIPFRFSLDRKQNTIALANQDEIIKQSQEILRSRHYSNKITEDVEGLLKHNVLYDKTKFLLAPFRYIRTNLDFPDTLTDNKTKILVKNLGNELLEVNGVPNENISYLKYKIDLQHGLIISSARKNRIKNKDFEKLYSDSKFKLIEPEEQLLLIERTNTRPKSIIVCGHIENPVSKQITLFTQTRIFGTELDSRSEQLDKSGNFKFEFKLSNPELIAIMNNNNNHHYSNVPILLYAKPGDSIYVNFSLEEKEYLFSNPNSKDTKNKTIFKPTMPVNITFSGDRSKEAEVIYRFLNQNNLPPIECRYNNFYFGTSPVDAEIFLKALDQIDTMFNPLKGDKSCIESAQYISKEIRAYLYTYLLNARTADDDLFIFTTSMGPSISAKKANDLYDQLDSLNIHRIYNDYGIFSRSLTQAYVDYKYYRITSSKNTFPLFYRLDPEQRLQLCKTVLFGSPMYREAASGLYNYLANSAKTNSKTDNQWQSEINEMFGLMLERCSDETFTRSLREIVENYNKWNEIKHVPDNLFLNLKGEKVSLHSFIAKRPTIICAAKSWSVGRYEMDEAARQHPEFNFIHIDEGDNYEYWKKWNARANPFAHQLYLSTDSLRLSDIFLNNVGKFIIFDKSGKRIGIEREIEGAIQVGEDGRRQYFKDVSKSVLSGIILFLGFLLLVSLAGFLVYKIRMNKKLKQQTQEKRLRELQMAAIRAQMNPHFLFNSLNSVQNLVQQNKNKEAHLYLSDFAGLIRKVLKNSDKEEVTLAEELETLEQYLNLEKLRFDFEYSIEVDDQIDKDLFMLPSLILQPFAENALVHGLQHKAGNKKLLVQITKIENAILIAIEDNGIGFDASKKLQTNSNGVGMRMNQERIQMMKEKYGGNYSFKIIDLAEQGLEGSRIEVIFPEEQ